MKHPTFVAEISANHLGSMDRAISLVAESRRAGADMVKFQCFDPKQMVREDMVIAGGPWANMNARKLYEECHISREGLTELFKFAKEIGVTPFASVFHPEDVAFLETLGCPMYKIASFEITDLNLIRTAAGTGKPIVISTGMATKAEILSAVAAALSGGALRRSVTLLKCTSAYPAPLNDANLATMGAMRQACDVQVGLSDHTLHYTAAMTATALGASMIEKHVKLHATDGGPDAAFSITPQAFAIMREQCCAVAKAVGEVRYGPTESEKGSLPLRRPSGGMRGEVTA